MYSKNQAADFCMGSIASYGSVQFFKNNLWWQIYPQMLWYVTNWGKPGGGSDNITWEEGNVLAPTCL
jgi:hypothetical protein